MESSSRSCEVVPAALELPSPEAGGGPDDLREEAEAALAPADLASFDELDPTRHHRGGPGPMVGHHHAKLDEQTKALEDTVS